MIREVQDEPAAVLDPELGALHASIGIMIAKPFAPDGRMKEFLTEAVATGSATSRSIALPIQDKVAIRVSVP